METMFLFCAIIGGTILVCQFLMTLFGMGAGGHDLDGGSPDFSHDIPHDTHAGGHHHDSHHSHSNALFKIITIRTLVAAIAFFGIAGMGATQSGFEPSAVIAIALAAAAGAMFAVFYLMKSLTRFDFDGNIHIEWAVGKPATVYVPIPASGAGAGKIQMKLQNQVVEFQATTRHERLASGAKVVVTGVIGPDTVEVAQLNESEIVSHV
jgi:hypothetical protein